MTLFICYTVRKDKLFRMMLSPNFRHTKMINPQYLDKGGDSDYKIDMHITFMYVCAQLLFQFR